MNHLSSVSIEAREECERARKVHPKPFNSAHEGYAVLREEVDELWDEVKKGGTEPRSRERMRKEALQVAAMALRFVLEVCDPEGPTHRHGVQVDS